MANYLKLLWQQLSASDVKTENDVKRIAALQQAAADRRAEYAHKKEQSEQAGQETLPGPLLASRKQMEQAESAHLAALQKWQNRESGQKSY